MLPNLILAAEPSAAGGPTLAQIVAILITLTAALAWVNVKFVKLPTTIGVMMLAMVVSLLLVGLHQVGLDLESPAEKVIGAIDFEAVVLDVLLAFLLFAGALHVDINDLLKQKFVILTLATLGVVASTLAVGTLAYYVLPLLGFTLTYYQALLLGAIVTPTDPIAVLGLMKSAGVPKDLETKVTGESLFNDGVGVVVFLALLGFAYPIATGHAKESGEAASIAFDIIGLFAVEVGGGILVGLVAGYLAYALIKRIDKYSVEVLITLALVVGGYVLCQSVNILGHHLSGPLAMVVAGLLMGNRGRYTGMSQSTREHLDIFWELIDELLNALLFVLIGLEVLVLTFTGEALLAGVVMIPLVLFARFVAVGGGVELLKRTGLRREFATGARRVLVWAGLRGGISVALALAIPRGGENRDVIITVAYLVVAFSIIVQGLTVPWVVRRSVPASERGASFDHPNEGNA